MKGIHVNPSARITRAEPGVTWAEVNHESQAFELAATGGVVRTPASAVSRWAAGSAGWSKHGCACDNLIAADVVTADGQLVTASAGENADLFRRIRGGGGDFGMVTSFEFRVHPAGTVLAGLVMHPISKGKEALCFWREYERTAPEETSNSLVVFTAPAQLPVPDVLRREAIVALGGVYVGALEEGERVLRPLREFGPPAADIYRPMPYSAAQTMADFLWPKGRYGYWKSSFLTAFSDGAIDTILKLARQDPISRHRDRRRARRRWRMEPRAGERDCVRAPQFRSITS